MLTEKVNLHIHSPSNTHWTLKLTAIFTWSGNTDDARPRALNPKRLDCDRPGHHKRLRQPALTSVSGLAPRDDRTRKSHHTRNSNKDQRIL